jgi:hypothetical protein
MALLAFACSFFTHGIDKGKEIAMSDAALVSVG